MQTDVKPDEEPGRGRRSARNGGETRDDMRQDRCLIATEARRKRTTHGNAGHGGVFSVGEGTDGVLRGRQAVGF